MAKKQWDKTLTVTLTPPFEGNYAEVRIKYDVDKIFRYDDEEDEIQKEVLAVEVALNERKEILLLQASDALTDEDRKPFEDELVEIEKKLEANFLQSLYNIVSFIVQRIDWEFDEPSPDPKRPETFDMFHRYVVKWIAYDGRIEALEKVSDPKGLKQRMMQ